MIAVITIDWIDFFMVMASSYKRHICIQYFIHTRVYWSRLAHSCGWTLQPYWIFFSSCDLRKIHCAIFAYVIHSENCVILMLLLLQKREKGRRREKGIWWDCWFYGVKWQDRLEDKEQLSYFRDIGNIRLAGNLT